MPRSGNHRGRSKRRAVGAMGLVALQSFHVRPSSVFAAFATCLRSFRRTSEGALDTIERWVSRGQACVSVHLDRRLQVPS